MDICKYKELYPDRIVSIIESQKTCILGTSNNTSISMVPMWYIYACEGNTPVFYLISMDQGNKMQNMEGNGTASIFIENITKNNRCSVHETVLVNGFSSFIDNPIEQCYIMKRFMEKYRKPITCCNNMPLKFIKISVKKISGRAY